MIQKSSVTPRLGKVLLVTLGLETGLSPAFEGGARAVWVTAQDMGLSE